MIDRKGVCVFREFEEKRADYRSSICICLMESSVEVVEKPITGWELDQMAWSGFDGSYRISIAFLAAAIVSGQR